MRVDRIIATCTCVPQSKTADLQNTYFPVAQQALAPYRMRQVNELARVLIFYTIVIHQMLRGREHVPERTISVRENTSDEYLSKTVVTSPSCSNRRNAASHTGCSNCSFHIATTETDVAPHTHHAPHITKFLIPKLQYWIQADLGLPPCVIILKVVFQEPCTGLVRVPTETATLPPAATTAHIT